MDSPIPCADTKSYYEVGQIMPTKYAKYLVFFKSPASELWWVRDDNGNAYTFTTLEAALSSIQFRHEITPSILVMGEGLIIVKLNRSVK